jgi:SAM-dependent methyltransferase
MPHGDRRGAAPAAERNKGPILEVLKRVLPTRGEVLEIASGTGQHVAHFAKSLPSLTWQPTETDVAKHDSIAAWIEFEGLSNVRAPLALDVGRHPWPIDHADAILCINMIHISPWQATLDLIAGAARVLGEGGLLILYGPYRRLGAHTAPSNEAFDADLRARNPAWGVRDMEAVTDVARERGFALVETVPMPANNFSVVFRKDTARG